MCVAVDKFRTVFGIHNFLAVVQTVIAGSKIAYGNTERTVFHARHIKHFNRKNQ